MSFETRIRAAVSPIVPEVQAGVYTGSAEEFCAFVVTEVPMGFGNDRHHATRGLVQLNWHLPYEADPTEKKRQLRRAIIDAGFTAPTVEDTTVDTMERRLTFEFEGLDGAGV